MEAFKGLDDFSHIWIIFVFHSGMRDNWKATVRPPRLGGNRRVGVFSTRSGFRPNPIGLSAVRLEKIVREKKETRLYLGGVDLMDGTPVLDIKPYLPEVESIPEARTGWPKEVAREAIEVEFTEHAQALLESWQSRHPERALREIVVETLQLDPRPVVYRGYEAGESPYRNEHAVRLFEGDIHFRFETPNFVRVLDILFTHN
jgi:tRNA-Thr(GGU) m(6)t(6)A37 methyltransferase TsaA